MRSIELSSQTLFVKREGLDLSLTWASNVNDFAALVEPGSISKRQENAARSAFHRQHL
jgi:hypothetical protein